MSASNNLKLPRSIVGLYYDCGNFDVPDNGLSKGMTSFSSGGVLRCEALGVTE